MIFAVEKLSNIFTAKKNKKSKKKLLTRCGKRGNINLADAQKRHSSGAGNRPGQAP